MDANDRRTGSSPNPLWDKTVDHLGYDGLRVAMSIRAYVTIAKVNHALKQLGMF